MNWMRRRPSSILSGHADIWKRASIHSDPVEKISESRRTRSYWPLIHAKKLPRSWPAIREFEEAIKRQRVGEKPAKMSTATVHPSLKIFSVTCQRTTATDKFAPMLDCLKRALNQPMTQAKNLRCQSGNPPAERAALDAKSDWPLSGKIGRARNGEAGVSVSWFNRR